MSDIVKEGEKIISNPQGDITLDEMRTTLDGLDMVVFVADVVANKILFMSAGCEKIYGVPPKTFYDNPDLWLTFFPPEERMLVEKEMWEWSQGKPSDSIHRIVRPDGIEKWTETKTLPILDTAGTLIRITGFITDITKRKKEENEAIKMHQAIQESFDALLETDTQGTITYVNDAFVKLYGYQPEEVVGKVTPRILKDGAKTAEQFKEFWETLLQKRNMRWEIVNKAKDGRLVTIDANANAILDNTGTIVGFIEFQRNITERKQQEARIKELSDLRMKFIQIVSHQLRTPLGSIRWNLELLMDGSMGPLTDSQKDFLRVTHNADVEVLDRINDLLIVVDIEENRIAFMKENISIEGLLSSVLGELRPHCATKELACNFHTPEVPLDPMFVDPQKIRQVFIKLIDNAITYTPEKGRVEGALTKVGNMIRFEIADNGIGIPAAEQKNIFLSFVRGTNAFLMKPDSTGVGLTIAKYFVEQHGGTIGFTSEEGKGSTFWFEIPITRENSAPATI